MASTIRRLLPAVRSTFHTLISTVYRRSKNHPSKSLEKWSTNKGGHVEWSQRRTDEMIPTQAEDLGHQLEENTPKSASSTPAVVDRELLGARVT